MARIKSRHVKDMAINVGAYAVPVGFNQLVLLPYLAYVCEPNLYAVIIAITSLINMIPNTLSRSLNNIRLVRDTSYSSKSDTGDFQSLMVAGQAVCLIVLMIVSYQYISMIGLFDYLLLAAVSFSWFAREYYCVTFRLQLNFKQILWNNIILVVGYSIGLLVFFLTGSWPLIYLIGQTLSCLYIFKRTDIHKVRPCVSPHFKRTAKDYGWLVLSDCLTSALSNADKLIVLPLLGPVLLGVYYAASVIPRMMSLVVTPVNSVMLSYLAKKKKKDGVLFWQAVMIGFSIAVIGFLLLLVIGPLVLNLLYPRYAVEATTYLIITSLITAVAVMVSVVRPFVMRFCSMVWQAVINGSSLLVSIVLMLFLIPHLQVWGVCVAVLVANLMKFCIYIVVYVLSSRAEKSDRVAQED